MNQPNASTGAAAAAVDVCAPFAGVARLQVAEGDEVAVGQPVAVVEAVKLEAAVVAPCPGVVAHVAAADYADVAGGDAVARITPADAADAPAPGRDGSEDGEA
ncbi:biotin/lipoyl-containing protein [Corynebacterium sp. 335C]